MSDDTAIRRKLRLLKQHSDQLAKMTPTDAELADAVGHTRAIEVVLADTRRRWERLVVEYEPVVNHDPGRRANPNERAGPPQVEGKDYELVKQYKNVYTYNTPAILTTIAKATGVGPTDALMDAIGAGAARLTWALTPLRKYLADVDAMLTTAHHEVSDHDGLDEAMIGKVQVDNGVKRVPLKREG